LSKESLQYFGALHLIFISLFYFTNIPGALHHFFLKRIVTIKLSKKQQSCANICSNLGAKRKKGAAHRQY